MKDYEKEIARKYLLPERPFLHGMASAFDMFGVLNHGKSEQLLANLQEEFRQRDSDIVRSAWRKVGKSLYSAMIQYEKAGGDVNNQ